jgi:alkanesulfonate monooxygenase SsuD/methylene tetrahydromethanopterin reductase-like flavin-dependent oxidoreductase (luciferase family)
VSRKLEALAGHCERLGRARSDILMSWNRVVCIAPTAEQAVAERDAYLALRGMDFATLPEDFREVIDAMIVVGDADTVGERFAEWKALGLDGFTVSMPANTHLPERVELLGRTLAPIVAA